MKIIDLKNFSLNDITPENLKNNSDVKAIIYALDEQLQQITSNIPEVAIIYAVDNLDAPELDFLAQHFHTDFYELAGTVDMKRDAIKNSVRWHLKKGTSWAIVEALREIGITAEFLHWHDTGDEPYTFKINAEITGDYHKLDGRDKIIYAIRHAIEQAKAARSLLTELKTFIKADEKINLFTGQASLISGHAIIRPYRERELENKIFQVIATLKNFSESLNLNDNLMNLVLERFEERISKRLEQTEKNIDEKNESMKIFITLLLQQHSENISAQLKRIEDLLLWKESEDD